jgi:hypothetical protein
MYSHSGATLSKMLECLVNFMQMQIEWICNRILSQQKNVCDNFFCDRTNVRSKLLLLGHLPNFIVGHCPMSDSNLQPCSVYRDPGNQPLRYTIFPPQLENINFVACSQSKYLLTCSPSESTSVESSLSTFSARPAIQYLTL